MVLQLQDKNCVNCASNITVNDTKDIESFDEYTQVTGMYLLMTDGRNVNDTVGCLCMGCADELAHTGKIRIIVDGFNLIAYMNQIYFNFKPYNND